MNTTTAVTMIVMPNLQLFADGGAGAAGAGEGTGATAAAAGQQTGASKGLGIWDAFGNLNEEAARSAAGSVKQKAEKVSEAPAEAAAEAAAADPDADFEALIKGQYKAQYDKRVQDTVKKRVSALKQENERLKGLSPTLVALATKYHLDPDDIDGINKAVQADESYFEDAALEKGMDVDTFREFEGMRRKLEAQERAQQEMTARQQVETDVRAWMEQAEALRDIYPDINVMDELNDPDMVTMMKLHLPLETAYMAKHARDIVPRAMNRAASDAVKRTTAAVASGSRPRESALGANSAAVTTMDVSHMTRQQRADIIRRVQAGEIIKI